MLLQATLIALAPASVSDLLRSTPAESLVAPLERFEAGHRGPAAAEAALTLGRLHYARGEYRQAADCLERAGARLEPARKAEALYWAGLSHLGAGNLARARATLDEAARAGSPRRAEALLGVSLVWERSRRPERSLETLEKLLGSDPGEAGPPALELQAALAERLARPEAARIARERLVRDYPRSIEAARASLVAEASAVAKGQVPREEGAPRGTSPAPGKAGPARVDARPPRPAPVGQGALTVQIGAFSDPGRAQDLAESARRAGFGPVRVSPGRAGGLLTVRVGTFATAEDARAAGERLARALGVQPRVVAAP